MSIGDKMENRNEHDEHTHYLLVKILDELVKLNSKWDIKENSNKQGSKGAFSAPITASKEINSLPTPDVSKNEISDKTMNWNNINRI